MSSQIGFLSLYRKLVVKYWFDPIRFMENKFNLIAKNFNSKKRRVTGLQLAQILEVVFTVSPINENYGL